MQINVKVKIGKQGIVKGWDGDTLHVGVNAAPINGASNIRLIEIISDWANVSKSRIYITKGLTSRNKVLNLEVDSGLLKELIKGLPEISKQQSLF